MTRTGILGLHLSADDGLHHLGVTVSNVEEAVYDKIVNEMRARRPKAKVAVADGLNQRVAVRVDRISLAQFVPYTKTDDTIEGGGPA